MAAAFARVHSAIGSFTSIQWHPEAKQDGGYIFPFMIRKMAKRNIRVWMSDGTDDIENAFGSWPLQNIELANSLKMREYDYHAVQSRSRVKHTSSGERCVVGQLKIRF